LGVASLDVGPLVRELAASLREQGADLVVVLSHLGLEQPEHALNDRVLAAEVQGAVDLIVGAHSHHLLPDGEWVGSVLVVQAGERAGYLGRVEIGPGGMRASVEAVGEDVPPHPAVLAAAASVEPEIESLLGEVIGELPEALDPEAASRWVADILRIRMGADAAIVSPGAAFTAALPAGPLRRGTLWEACESRANPAVVTMTGSQLGVVLDRGRDAELAATSARALRGRPRGVLQVSGPDSVDPARDYRVAGTDWELEPYGGLVDRDWGLRPDLDFPTILREAVEEHLRDEA
jgi:2',3'-cyclic-nucleotide 2'-phosphodiesterase (5'-nucleotidase family)